MVEPVSGLADAIDALRTELGEAFTHASGEDIRFRLRRVELTLQAVVTRGGDGRIGWGVLGVGAKLESTATQNLRIELEPVLESGTDSAKRLVVADQDDEAPHFG